MLFYHLFRSAGPGSFHHLQLFLTFCTSELNPKIWQKFPQLCMCVSLKLHKDAMVDTLFNTLLHS